jgi:hypothetical protein
MRQSVEILYERLLSQRATEVHKQMTELGQLRELVRLAEAAKAMHRPKGLACNPINSKAVDRFTGSQQRV